MYTFDTIHFANSANYSRGDGALRQSSISRLNMLFKISAKFLISLGTRARRLLRTGTNFNRLLQVIPQSLPVVQTICRAIDWGILVICSSIIVACSEAYSDRSATSFVRYLFS